MKFKTKDIYHYFHIDCAFKSFEKAKTTLNTITSMDNINGFELIKDEDKQMILKLMEKSNARIKAAESSKHKLETKNQKNGSK